MIDHSIIRPIHVLIVDDHPVLRSGLEAMLRAEGSFQITASVSHARAALAACQSLTLPDIVLMDVRMPECDGFLIRETTGINHQPYGFSTVALN